MEKRFSNLGHRRTDVEAGTAQGVAALPRTPQPRSRTPRQRRDFYSTTEHRSPRAQYAAPSEQLRRSGGSARDEQLRIETERHNESERERLLKELVELSRAVKALRFLNVGRPSVEGAQSSTAFEPKTRPPAMSQIDGPSLGIEQSIQTPLDGNKASGPSSLSGGSLARLRPQEPQRHYRPIPVPSPQKVRANIITSENSAGLARTQASSPAGFPGDITSAQTAPKRVWRSRLKVASMVAFSVLAVLLGTTLTVPELRHKVLQATPLLDKITDILVQIHQPSEKVAPVRQSIPEPTPRATQAIGMPDNYGVYAISNGQLISLEQLAISVPDARVSISSSLSTPAPPPLASGNLSFVAYNRDLATSVPESASVRAVAKVVQAPFYAGSTPRATAVAETWAVRGGGINLRIAPVPENQEMILIRAADSNYRLSPGRYILTFKNKAYDFSVAGNVTDTAQCLERSDLDGHSIYSECRDMSSR